MIDHGIGAGLQARAQAAGVQTSYINVDRRLVHSSARALRGVLDALEPTDPVHDATLDVVVAWDGIIPVLPADVRVVDQDGRQIDHTRAVPLGYHHLERGDATIGTVVSAPVQVPRATPGQWGVFLPLYALRTSHTHGVADFTDLARLFDWLHDRHGEVLLTLPLSPLYLDEPADWSPYAPVSRRMWNEFYVDLDEIVTPDLCGPPPEPQSGLLDYIALDRHHTARLDAAARLVWGNRELHGFVEAHPLVSDYARFRAAQARHGRDFRAWRATRARALAEGDPVVERRHLVGAWLAERQLATVAGTARDRGQRLALDLALGSHRDGFDVFHEDDLFVDEVTVGAPPDPIFAGGQDWGFPPLHPARSRASGHRCLRETLRHHLRHAAILRLDHVAGLARQWWIPRGYSATDGAYVTFPFDELLAVACLEAHLADAIIVGENLGTVPPEVDEALHAHGMLGIHVGHEALPSFGSDHRRMSSAGEVAMLTTHDSMPFAGFWWGHDIIRAARDGFIDAIERTQQLEERAMTNQRVIGQLRADGRLDPASRGLRPVIAALAEDLAAQPAEIVVLNMEDLWLEAEPQNAPGTFHERPNWRRTAAMTLEEVEADEEIDAALSRVHCARQLVSGREPSTCPGGTT